MTVEIERLQAAVDAANDALTMADNAERAEFAVAEKARLQWVVRRDQRDVALIKWGNTLRALREAKERI